MLHEISNSFIKLIVSEQGAEMHSVFNQKLNRELLWQADPAVWARHAPVLFPIVGKLKNDEYFFEGTKYNLPQHGFARDKIFSLIEKSNDTLSFELNADEESLGKYPFLFNLKITYKINNNKVECIYDVYNTSNKPIYFSIGAHPGFVCPLDSDEKFSDYSIVTKNKELTRYHIEGGLQTGKTGKINSSEGNIHLNADLFANDAIIIKDSELDYLLLFSKKYKLQFNWFNMPYFGIWTKPGHESFICLEPWAGIADTIDSSGILNEKEGIICLENDKKFSCGFSFEASSLT